MKRSSIIVIGLALIGIGIISGGNTLNIWDIDIFFDGWWTLFLIIPGLISLIKNGPNFGNLALILVGAAFLVSSQDFIPSGLMLRLMFPALLILCGLGLLFGRTMRRGNFDASDFPTYQAYLGATVAKNTSPDLKGAKIQAFMGGAEIDFRQAKVLGDIEITVTAVLGGVELFVPLNVRIEVRGTPVLGGIENTANFPHQENGPTVFINCNAVLGGIEIK